MTLKKLDTVRMPAAGLAAAMMMSGAASAGAINNPAHDAEFDQKVMNALERCQTVSESCAAASEDAAGVLVFPEVIKASLGVGGSGAKGALLIDGQIEGYYSMWNASLGLQAGVQKVSETLVFQDDAALNDFRDSPEWEVGADAEVTLATAGASAQTRSGGENSPVRAFVYDQGGLAAGIAIEGTRIQTYEADGDARMDDSNIMEDDSGMTGDTSDMTENGSNMNR